MYKVFVDNISICFQKDISTASNLPASFLPSVQLNDFESFKNTLEAINTKESIYFKSDNPMESIKTVFRNFKWIEAAGGIVQNTKTNQYLFIFRNGLWDIPKGKIETDEHPKQAAIREIEEECGVSQLEITGELSPTYHVYYAYEKYFIKKTYWFTLQTVNINTSPQQEEGITEVKWFRFEDIDMVKKHTFASIQDVLEEWSIQQFKS